ncbi:MAG: hypothetical protein NTY25_11050 [Planctomycetia bacterium]|nr:hypothetical protein [Planctomycetia bacterium]
MAKKILALLTKAEKMFLDSSIGQSLAKATHVQVQAAAKQARVLRKKWRDLHESQMRSTKRSAGAATRPTNARSLEKHNLFSAAVVRLEKRLAELASLVTSSPVSKSLAKKTVAASKKVGLVAKRVKVAAQSKIAPRAKIAARVSARASRAAVRADLSALSTTQAIQFDRVKQRSALTAAKAGRIKQEGLGTRRLGHAAARGKRTQARRDTRSR